MSANNGRIGQRRTIALICLILAVVTFAVYWPVRGNDFVNYDDNVYITENAHVRNGLNWPDLKWAFTTGHTGYSHPLTWLTHQLDYERYGGWAGGHHLTSLAIHILNSLLLFLLFFRMTRAIWPSAFVAAIFAIHPLHVESVAWVAERKDVLSGLFFLLTLHAYAFYTKKPRLLRYLLALFLFALGLLSKPMIVTLPVVLLLLDYWPLRRMTFGASKADRSREQPIGWLILEKVPFLFMAAAWSLITFIIVRESRLVVEEPHLGVWLRGANALVSYATYFLETFWPRDLSVFYPHPVVWPWGIVLGATTLLALISALCIARKSVAPYLIVGWFWYLGMLVPVIGLIQAGAQARADRYTYLPQIGLCLALSWGLADVFKNWSYRRYILPAGATVVLALLVCATWYQTQVWRDSESLWRHALATTSDNDAAHIGLCDALLQKGRADEAMRHAEMALRIRPNGVDAHNHLGIVLASKGRPDDALIHFQRVLEMKPNRPKLHYNLATVLLQKGQVDEAISHFQKELQIQPGFVDAHNNLGIALSQRRKADEALVHFQRALEIDPNRPRVNYNLANVLLQKGQADEAIVHLQKELQIQPNYTEALNDLGIAFSQKGQINDAIAHWQKTLEVQPENLNALCNLAWIFATYPDASIRNGAKALNLAQHASQLSGGTNPRILRLVAAAHAENGQFAEAIGVAQKAVQLATALGDSGLVQNLQTNVALFQASSPLRDTAQSTSKTPTRRP